MLVRDILKAMSLTTVGTGRAGFASLSWNRLLCWARVLSIFA